MSDRPHLDPRAREDAILRFRWYQVSIGGDSTRATAEYWVDRWVKAGWMGEGDDERAG